METVLNFVLTHAGSLTVLLQSAICISGFVWIKTSSDRKIDGLDHKIDMVESSLTASIKGQIDGLDHKIDMVESSLHRRIDGVEASIKELKHNDFAHMNNTMESLTYVLEKNGALTQEDKKYIDDRRLTN